MEQEPPQQGATTPRQPQGREITPTASRRPPPPAAAVLYPQYPWLMVTPPGNLGRFSHRHWLFKLAIAGLAVAAAIFSVAFFAPFWADNAGLWFICQGDSCDHYVGIGPEWLDVVRSLETVALAAFAISLAVELYQDACQTPPPSDNKVVEILGMAAGVFGVSGLILFAEKQEYKLKYHYNRYNFRDGYDYEYATPTLNWGFWLAAGGLILGTLCSMLIAFSRVRHAKRTKQAMAKTMHSTPIMGNGCPAPAYTFPVMMPPRQATPASQTNVQEMPTSQMAAQEMPASQVAGQEMPASQVTTAQEMPASDTTAAEEMVTLQMTAAQEMSASQVMAAQEADASQMMATQELPASLIMATEETPTPQTTAAPGIAMMAFTPTPEVGGEEGQAPGDGRLSERL